MATTIAVVRFGRAALTQHHAAFAVMGYARIGWQSNRIVVAALSQRTDRLSAVPNESTATGPEALGAPAYPSGPAKCDVTVANSAQQHRLLERSSFCQFRAPISSGSNFEAAAAASIPMPAAIAGSKLALRSMIR